MPGSAADPTPAAQPDAGRQRLDKWLFFARFFKTRTLAAEVVRASGVRVNGTRIHKPSASVRIGDVLTFVAHERVRVAKVLAPGIRRGPAVEAQTLYEDLTPPAAPKDGATPAPREAGAGRPTKRDRRRIDALKES